MGRKAREYKVEAYILGANYMAGRDDLITALETAGAAQLVHPYHGTVNVTAMPDCQLTESTREGGMAKFSITFLEAGKQTEPTTSDNTEAALVNQQNACDKSYGEDFGETFDVAGQPDFVVDDALENTDDLLSLPEMDLGNLDWIRADPLSTIQGLLPENLMTSLAAPLAFAAGLLALVRKAGDLESLFTFAAGLLDDADSAVVTTPSRQQLVANQAGLGNLMLQGATSRRIFDLATSAPATVDEARAVRNEIVSRSDVVLFSPGVSQAASEAMIQLRTNALEHLAATTVGLPQLVTVTRQATAPAVVLAHDFYGDSWLAQGLDADLVTRNDVHHPGFVAAGKPIKFIAG
jgi:prophage DNA circulation protein